MGPIKRTKIIATLGPSTGSPEMIEKLMHAGVNVFRLNFSHGTHDSHLELIGWIKEKRQKLKYPVAILQDLSGPKIRLGKISGRLQLKPGDEIVLQTGIDKNRGKTIPVNYDGFARDVQPGHHLLLADGRLEIEILRVEAPKVFCRVLVGGELTSAKGINYPEGSFTLPAVTEKDQTDLRFGLRNGVDMVALSFIKSAEDITTARRICKEEQSNVPLIAKIEKHEAIKNFPDILMNVDGVMVARGDLGVEVPIEKVPIVQKRIIQMANHYGKPVITATQMLMSMVEAPRPTRAEATDIANAILDGTDAIMLSEETAAGKYPLKAVEIMTRIALETEKDFPYYQSMFEGSGVSELDLAKATAYSAASLARRLEAQAILCPTSSGFTARMISRFRPRAIILALAPSWEVYYRLALLWGVVPRFMPVEQHMDDLLEDALALACEHDFLKPQDRYVITAGFPFGMGGPTNLINAGEVPSAP